MKNSDEYEKNWKMIKKIIMGKACYPRFKSMYSANILFFMWIMYRNVKMNEFKNITLDQSKKSLSTFLDKKINVIQRNNLWKPEQRRAEWLFPLCHANWIQASSGAAAQH